MRPVLIVVSGPPASGKTTLAHAVARAVPCPAICRDEIKEGLVHHGGYGPPTLGDAATRLATAAFFDVVDLLLRRGVTLVAEAAFQHKVWAPKLVALSEVATVRVIRCVVDEAIRHDRRLQRAQNEAQRRLFHADADAAQLDRIERGEVRLAAHEPIQLDLPTLVVDTSDGYRPALEAVVLFARE